ncbi:MAG TPA: ATP-binding cassette domain-containing protein, partial [Solirubrobacteraceae bacterium]|nr:ATP-binding cassette domain-containing protein [Solirubrobacteraceae bacterium]
MSELLARFGLSEAADRLARTYSGGMQRRLDIAMGLVHRPQVLFLDESTTGLDPEVRAAMWDEISRLALQDGLTILLTTHYLEKADQLAHRVAIVDRGRVVAGARAGAGRGGAVRAPHRRRGRPRHRAGARALTRLRRGRAAHAHPDRAARRTRPASRTAGSTTCRSNSAWTTSNGRPPRQLPPRRLR